MLETAFFVIFFKNSLLYAFIGLLNNSKEFVDALSFEYVVSRFLSSEGLDILQDQVLVKHRESAALTVEPSDVLQNLTNFFNTFDLNSKVLENALQKLAQWKSENFEKNPDEATWLRLRRPNTITSAVFASSFRSCPRPLPLPAKQAGAEGGGTDNSCLCVI